MLERDRLALDAIRARPIAKTRDTEIESPADSNLRRKLDEVIDRVNGLTQLLVGHEAPSFR